VADPRIVEGGLIFQVRRFVPDEKAATDGVVATLFVTVADKLQQTALAGCGHSCYVSLIYGQEAGREGDGEDFYDLTKPGGANS
jgi:hypothetical protein